VSIDLWAWWEFTLTEGQRDRLMTESGRPLPPDLARDIWRRSGSLRVLEPEHWVVTADPQTWRLTAEAEAFVAERDYERRHPGAEFR
jgi:hypothetical protein